jgi:DNA-binding transcriptional regulator YhcF (GntR family)
MKKTMKKLSLSIKALAIASTMFFASCSNLLNVEPRQSIDSATALTTQEALEAAVSGVYDRLQALRMYGRDFIALPEALSDNGRATNKSGRLQAEYQNQPNAHFAAGTWQLSYAAINQINLILDNAPKVNMPAATRNNIEGQALFLRALIYHNLMRAYAYDPGAIVTQNSRGGVPLALTPILGSDQIEKLSRAPIDAVYAQIYKDLDDAIVKLATTPNSRAPFYATRAAAEALYSRVALYRRDYANVVRFADAALSRGVGTFVTNAQYVASWRAAIHPESIFELQYVTAENLGVNEALQTTYTTLLAVGDRSRTGGFGDLVPTADLLNIMQAEGNDVRRQLYELGTTGRGTAEIECTKFMGKGGQPNLDNIPVIRVSEVILNRAEAYAMQNNDALALADLNRIRNRAGLPSVTLSGAALLEEILKQRRIELAFEGDRWFTLKRLGRDIVKAPPVQTVPFIDFRILAPIPVREIQANPNLQQNFGY